MPVVYALVMCSHSFHQTHRLSIAPVVARAERESKMILVGNRLSKAFLPSRPIRFTLAAQLKKEKDHVGDIGEGNLSGCRDRYGTYSVVTWRYRETKFVAG